MEALRSIRTLNAFQPCFRSASPKKKAFCCFDQNVLAMNQERGATWREVHNVYLQYAVDLGLPGLSLFLALYVSLFRTAGRVRRTARRLRSTRDVAAAAGSVQVAFVGFAVAAFFHPVAYQFYFFLAAGLALAVQNVLRSAGPAPVRQPA